MQIIVNDEPFQLKASDATLSTLIQLLNLSCGFAIAVNGQVIPHQRYKHFWLSANDTVDIVTVLEGG